MSTIKEELIALRKGENHPERSGEYWNKEERQALTRDFMNGTGISDMAIKYQRTELAVVQELKTSPDTEEKTKATVPRYAAIVPHAP